MKNKDFNKILSSVPPNYYQKGAKNNLLKKYWHFKKASFAVKLLKAIPFKNCLDVGCASGFMASKIAKRFPKARFFGVDAYKEAITYAKHKYPSIKFIHAEAEKLPFKPNQFDLILCYETIEHVRNPKKAMLELKRVLKPKGTLILSMDSGNLAFRIIWFFWEKTYGKAWQNAHLNTFHHTDLEKLIINSGFNIKKKYFTHFRLEVVYVAEKIPERFSLPPGNSKKES